MKRTILYASYFFACSINVLLMGCGDTSTGSTDGNSGSKAKLITMNGDVFTIADESLVRIDLTDPSNPVVSHKYHIGTDIQTLTSDGEVLYVGGEFSVSNYRYNEESGFEFISVQDRRIRGRDPVITDGQYAYSTFITRDWGTEDDPDGDADLYVYEILEDKSLNEIGIYTNLGYLHGLALWENNLLVCDYHEGILHIDVSEPSQLDIKQTLSYAPCEDIVHLGSGHFATVGKEGIFQLKPIEEDRFALISMYK